jgi:hypothetical protein
VPDAVQVRTILAPTTEYSQRALDDLAVNGHAIDDADIERLPPPGTDQMTLTGPLPDRTPRSPWCPSARYLRFGDGLPD